MVTITGKNDTKGAASESPDIKAAKKKAPEAEIKDSKQDIEEAAESEPKKIAPDIGARIAEMAGKSKRIKRLKAFAMEERTQLLQTGGLLLALIIMLIIASSVSFSKTGVLKGQLAQLNSDYNSLNNDIDVFKKTNPYYTKVESSAINIQNVNWLPVHAKADMAKVTMDKQIFWDWIAQAFDSNGLQHPDLRNSTGGRGWIDARYDEPTEEMYEEVMQRMAKSQNMSMDIPFFTTFMSYSDYVGTQADYYRQLTYLIGSTDSGDYHYLALVPMTTYKKNPRYTMIAFTFTIRHDTAADNSDVASITDFNVWPPDYNNPTMIGG